MATIKQADDHVWTVELTDAEVAVEAAIRKMGWQTIELAIQRWLDAQARMVTNKDIAAIVPILKQATADQRAEMTKTLSAAVAMTAEPVDAKPLQPATLSTKDETIK